MNCSRPGALRRPPYIPVLKDGGLRRTGLKRRTPKQLEKTIFRVVGKFKPDANGLATRTESFSAATVRHAEPTKKTEFTATLMQEIPHGFDLGFVASSRNENTVVVGYSIATSM